MKFYLGCERAAHPSHLLVLVVVTCRLCGFAVEPCENEENETMETLVAADSLLSMECPDTCPLSLEQHYSKKHSPAPEFP